MINEGQNRLLFHSLKFNVSWIELVVKNTSFEDTQLLSDTATTILQRWYLSLHCKIFASGVNFSRKQHFISHYQDRNFKFTHLLVFFSKTCWISSFLTKLYPNYLHVCAITLLSREWKMSQITLFDNVKFLAWKSGCVKSWTSIISE